MKLDNISKNLIYNINIIIKENNNFKSIFKKIDSLNTSKHYLIKFFSNYYKILNNSRQEISKYFDNTNKINLKSQYYKDIIINKDINNNINKYLSERFLNFYKNSIIKKSKNCKEVYTRNIDIKFYYENYEISNIDEIIYYLLLIFYTLSNLYNNNKKLNLIIFYFDFKKLSNNKSLSYNNINSGYSYNNIIVIFRKEEIFKVFIHELLHFIGLDNNYYLLPYSEKLLPKIFNIKSKHLYNEGYIEFAAIIYYNLFISFIFTKNFNHYKNLFNKLISYEILFTYIQVAKILNIYNLSPYDFFKENNYKEDTNIFAYFYLKLLMLEKYNIFLYYVINNNKIVYFNEINLYNYIINLFQNNFLSYILDNIEIIQKIIFIKCNNIIKNTKNNTKNYFCNNLRLSLIELYI